MSPEPTKDELGKVIDRLWKELGFTSRSAFWDGAGITNKTYWNKRAEGEVPTAKKHIDQIIKGLIEENHTLSTKQKQALYEAIGMVITLEVNSTSQTEPSSPSLNTYSAEGNFPNSQVNMASTFVNSPQTLTNITQITSIPTCPSPPAPPTHFGGRNVELNKLKQDLKTANSVPIAVHGFGGMGKTTLAKQAAHDLYVEQGPDKTFRAVLWSNITLEADAAELLLEWARKADPNFQLLDNEKLPQLANRVKALLEKVIENECKKCGPNRTLVVLDDVWENGLDLVKLLLSARPIYSTVLITTRAWTVISELGAKQQLLKYLQPKEGAELLKTYLPDVTDTSKLEELAKSLGGHALALKLAAKRLLTKLNYLKKLENHIAQYKENLPFGTEFNNLELEQGQEKEDNLTLALYYSYKELKHEEQARFRALGAIAYGQSFNTTILAGVWGVEAIKVEEYAERLWQLSLLEIDQEKSDNYGDTWYQLHPILQSYALALLKQESNEYKEINNRYEEQITTVTEQFNKIPPQKWGQIMPYLAHIHFVGDNLTKQTSDRVELDQVLANRVVQFTYNIISYLMIQREIKKLDWLKMGVLASGFLGNLTKKAFFLLHIGNFYDDFDQSQEALQYYEEALSISEAEKDLTLNAAILSAIGKIYHFLDNDLKAIDYCEQALSTAKTANNLAIEAITLNHLGLIYSNINDKQKALNYYNQALSIFQMTMDRLNEAATLYNIGDIHNSIGDKQEALNYYLGALNLSNQVGHTKGQGKNLEKVLEIYEELGDTQKIIEYGEKLFSIKKLFDDKESMYQILCLIAIAYAESNNKLEALMYFQQAFYLTRDLQHLREQAIISSNMGDLYLEFGKSEKGLDNYNLALIAFQKVGWKEAEIKTLKKISDFYVKKGEPYNALIYYKRIPPIFKEIGDNENELVFHCNIATMTYNLGQREGALTIYKQVLPLARRIHNYQVEAVILYSMSRINWEMGNTSQAVKMLERAVDLSRKAQSPTAEFFAANLADMRKALSENT